MIYHTSVDTTNISNTADYIFSLMDKVVDEVSEENVTPRSQGYGDVMATYIREVKTHSRVR